MPGQYRATRDAIEAPQFGRYRATRDAIEVASSSKSGGYRATRDAIEIPARGGGYRATRDAIEVASASVLPTADPGPSLVTSAGSLITLDSSASSTVNGTITSRTWRQISKGDPADPDAVLSSTTAVAPTFRCPILNHPSTYTFGLVVTNSFGVASLEVSVAVGVESADVYVSTLAGWKPCAVITAGEPAWPGTPPAGAYTATYKGAY